MGDHDHYQDGEEGEAKPSFPEMPVAWVTSTNVVVCKEKCSSGGKSGAALTSEVLVLIVAMIEEALGTGETGDALNALPQHVWTITTRARPVL